MTRCLTNYLIVIGNTSGSLAGRNLELLQLCGRQVHRCPERKPKRLASPFPASVAGIDPRLRTLSATASERRGLGNEKPSRR